MDEAVDRYYPGVRTNATDRHDLAKRTRPAQDDERMVRLTG
jgi:hypothetical protein